MNYTYITDYKDNEVLRQSFNELAGKTYGINFEEWYQNGFWEDRYIPCSITNGETVIANVSVNLMAFDLDGTKKHYIQLGTVMTDKDYRGQGLSRMLIEKILDDYKDKVDGIYLFANNNVLSFYPKFGFLESKEYQYSKEVDLCNMKNQMARIDLTNPSNREKFLDTVKKKIPNYRLFMSNYGLTTFWTTGYQSNSIYYYGEEDAYIVAEITQEKLFLYDIISTNKVKLDKIINAFGSSIKKVYLGFTPYDTTGYDVLEHQEDDCTLFYIGKDLECIEKNKLMFPTLSHA